MLAELEPTARSADRRARAPGRLPLLHHQRRLARLLRREAAPALQEAVDEGYRHVKLKVGADLEDDIRRLRIAREVIGWDAQAHDRREPGVGRARRRSSGSAALAEFRPLWIEEPTSPDDVLGHAAIRRAVAPIGVATGEHGMNRVLFKQMFQAEAHRLLPARRRSARQRERDPRRLPDGHEVRCAGVPARRRGRAVRARAAPVDLRLRRRLGQRSRTGSPSTSTTCTSTSSTPASSRTATTASGAAGVQR